MQAIPSLPADLACQLLNWYDAGSRTLPWRSDPRPYYVWLSEIMLQQTRVEAATPYFERFILELPTIADLAAAPEQQLLKLWEGLGYYNRVRNLQRAAQIVVDTYGGELPADFELLLQLPGIGRYSAGAIASIAFGLPVPAVDGNVLRVLSRVLESPAPIDREETKRQMGVAISRRLPPDRPGDFNQALMELGAMVCLPNGAPRCEVCPLCPLCLAHHNGTISEYPRKAPKKARRCETRTVLVLFRRSEVAIRQRPATGLLRGLWELPNLEGALTPEEIRKLLADWGLSAGYPIALGEARHIFTHLEWQMTGWAVAVEGEPVQPLLFVPPEQLREEFCLPSAFRAYADRIPGLIKELQYDNHS